MSGLPTSAARSPPNRQGNSLPELVRSERPSALPGLTGFFAIPSPGALARHFPQRPALFAKLLKFHEVSSARAAALARALRPGSRVQRAGLTQTSENADGPRRGKSRRFRREPARLLASRLPP